MKYRLAYVELTNHCGLTCDFCPPESRPKSQMSQELFAKLAKELSFLTKRVALHLRGDPLAVASLDKYLKIANDNNLKIEITTNSYYLKKELFELLTSTPIFQINFSIQSILANPKLRSLEQNLELIVEFCNYALKKQVRPFINLRLWAMQNDFVTKYLQNTFGLVGENLAPKIRLKTAPIFEWPTLDSKICKNSYCHAPFDHFGVLSNGIVVPCCLDKDGIINLGDAHAEPLHKILNSDKIKTMKNAFKNTNITEDLCMHCSYRLKFAK